jgi:hypothetical protein
MMNFEAVVRKLLPGMPDQQRLDSSSVHTAPGEADFAIAFAPRNHV